MDNLKRYIMYIIINKDGEVNELKYAEVIKLLEYKIYNDDICSYIMKNALNSIVSTNDKPTNDNILNILTTNFCIEKAYEYIRFLQNDHEHDYEYMTR